MDDFLANGSPEWIESLQRRWRDAPDSLPADWRAFFSGFELGEGSSLVASAHGSDALLAGKQASVNALIDAYRTYGHLRACTDPLSPCRLTHPFLELSAFALTDDDLDVTFHFGSAGMHTATLREITAILAETYCREIGVEFMQMDDPDERNWLLRRIEECRNQSPLTAGERIGILERLYEATLFEELLQRRFPGQKRFSLEGAEVLIAVLDALLHALPPAGIADLVLGMPHRGRLNVLANIFGKPYENILAEFRDELDTGFSGEGDVKYHKGYSVDRELPGGQLHLVLAANPSHLEAVNGVVEGKCRARQQRLGEGGAQRVLPVLIHGDAAFAGQGSVMEVLNMSRLDGYATGGTIHIVVNNQIGFTTLPRDSRSTRYASDAARMLSCPVFHVQGEAPEAAVHAVRLALEYRQRFGRDVVVELIGYRRHGHNEGDEPAFTQPTMYRQLAGRPPVSRIYAETLAAGGIPREEVEAVAARVRERLEGALSREPQQRPIGFREQWDGMGHGYSPEPVETGVAAEKLLTLSRRLAELPAGFSPHAKVHALVRKRFEAVLKGAGIDWGNAEMLAFATLLDSGASIRLSGQDSRRGTFNHRHCVLYDLNDGSSCTPLASVAPPGAGFQVWDSPLSEFGVLAFEYGYSLETPRGLTIWEAQFGDFANGAQVVIDQFVASGETKWNRVSGLVMLLPHGYEGQGAEHSSARVERFLQLCSTDNMVVALPSTPAQLFHLLRRQLLQRFRKPLVLFTPKSLLRDPACVSPFAEFQSGGFRSVLADSAAPRDAAKVLLCSGKIAYALRAERERRGAGDTAIVTVEQLYPLDPDDVSGALSGFTGEPQLRWVQEEPENMGAWRHIRQCLSARYPSMSYVGRPASPCPASGSHRTHDREQEALLSAAFAG